MRIEHRSVQDPDETTILIEGLARAVTLVHVADSHLAEVDVRDEAALELGPKFTNSFRAHSPVGRAPREHFREVLAHCVALKADAIVLTGDIIHFPSWANVEALQSDLAAASIPYLYTPGNHDWHFPEMAWNDRMRREYGRRLARFSRQSPCHDVLDIGGVRLIGLDNSNYQISEAQLDYLRSQLDTPMACLLCVHVPIWIPSLVPDVMRRWGAPILMAAHEWTPETRAKWMVYETRPATQACHRLLLSGEAGNLAAILAGHIHIPHSDELRAGRYQYCAKPCYSGGFRVIRLLPAPGPGDAADNRVALDPAPPTGR